MATIINSIGKILKELLEVNPTSPAPIIIGIDNKKENLADSFGEKPNNNAMEIVIPDLEIPGKIATA